MKSRKSPEDTRLSRQIEEIAGGRSDVDEVAADILAVAKYDQALYVSTMKRGAEEMAEQIFNKYGRMPSNDELAAELANLLRKNVGQRSH